MSKVTITGLKTRKVAKDKKSATALHKGKSGPASAALQRVNYGKKVAK